MSDFLQSVLDMGAIHPTIYSDLQVASDGSFVSTEEANRLNLLDFSGMSWDTQFELDMDSASAPFGAGPSFPYGALDSEPFSMGGHLLGDWPIPPSSPGTANTAHEDLVTQIPSPPPIKRGFGNDLSNIERSTADLPPLLSSSSSSSGASTPEVATPTHLPSPISAPAPSLLSPSSLSPPSSPLSGVSTPKMATPTDLPSPVSAPAPTPSLTPSPSPSSSPSSGVSTPEVATPADMPSPVSVPASPSSSPISAPTPSPSSPAPTPAHSSSSPARKSAKQRRNAAPSTRPPNRSSASRPRNVPIVPAVHKVMCILEDCDKGFGDRTAMLRHVMSGHMRQRHRCHGCRKSFTRPDALVRHLNTTVLGSKCRRIKIVADFLS